jgi:urease accessory protein
MATTMERMDTATTITDAALLQLVWLASPALPVGGFSYSEGLEAAVEAGLVRDERSAGDWLVEQLHASVARADLAVVASAVAAARDADAPRIAQLDAWVRATRETSELRQQAEQMGRSMGEWRWSLIAGVGMPSAAQPTNAAAVGWVAEGTPTSPATYPVAFALTAATTTATPRHIALTFAFSWAENMAQAAIKSVPLGQSSGQRILARLAHDIPAAVDHALAVGDDDRQAFTPMLAILSAQHETQYSRLFRS